jgi:hypothetical protein
MEQKNMKPITTREFAKAVGVQAPSIHRALCMAGHYMGVKPVKLPNGRLIWPGERVDALVNG